jgi:hypothetical protein
VVTNSPCWVRRFAGNEAAILGAVKQVLAGKQHVQDRMPEELLERTPVELLGQAVEDALPVPDPRRAQGVGVGVNVSL